MIIRTKKIIKIFLTPFPLDQSMQPLADPTRRMNCNLDLLAFLEWQLMR